MFGTKTRSISAFLGSLGIANSLITGFYIVATCARASELLSYTRSEYLLHVYTTTIMIATIVTLLSYGTFLLWKDHARKGGTLNIGGGIFLCLIYTYYTFFFQPSLLSWLGPIGLLLFAPAVMSGIIGILSRNPDS